MLSRPRRGWPCCARSRRWKLPPENGAGNRSRHDPGKLIGRPSAPLPASRRIPDRSARSTGSVRSPCTPMAATWVQPPDVVVLHNPTQSATGTRLCAPLDGGDIISFAAEYFSCNTCGLVLDSYELLQEASMDAEFPAEVDPAIYYDYEPDYGQ